MKVKKEKRVTITKKYLDQLKANLSNQEEVNLILEKDLRIHRNFYVTLLREVIKIKGNHNGVSTDWLIERFAKHLNQVESWYWS
jgi:hypothetical protein